MKIFKKILFLFLFSIFSILIFAENFKNSENLITGKLENGIHYYIYKNKKPENKAMLSLVVKTGSLMEEDNEQGIAHFMEHMAFNGTTFFSLSISWGFRVASLAHSLKTSTPSSNSLGVVGTRSLYTVLSKEV